MKQKAAAGRAHFLPGAQISANDAIIAFRHRIIHGYDSVDDIIVWNTLQREVPVLRAEVEKLIG